MAFSFRIGTKWCHDFPKLAKESGFYFNMHRSRIRIDWNRISNIDIDRIIREKDFHSIDDNINSVIDYCLESEYDIKILDPNFVKLFRLAQLAVEYLLYCKQYLDHSVVILKDELKLKIEENMKLKKEITTLEEVVKHIKEKARERSKIVETRIGDCSGEIFKCPHCPKTFISPVYLSAHIIRRHAYGSDLYMPPSPMHEHYRTETERLHNEIKTLKERLNETERVIRNESEKAAEKKALDYDKRQVEDEIETFKHDTNKSEEHSLFKGYQEEIKTLRTMLFDEIHNFRQKESNMYEHTSETNVQTLISKQEKEFQKLKDQLLEKLTPDIESMQAKLHAQENYWKSKIEHLEDQHYKDVERLTTELKLTQKAAEDMKVEYESKVNDLERQTANQSSILIEQSKQLHSLSQDRNVSQLNEKKQNSESLLPDKINEILKKSDQSNLKEGSSSFMDTKIQQILVANYSVDSMSGSALSTSNSKHKFVTHDHKKKAKQKIQLKNEKHAIGESNEKEIRNYSGSEVSKSEEEEAENNSGTHVKYNQPNHKKDLIGTSISRLGDTSNKNTINELLSNIRNVKQSDTLEGNSCSETNSESSISGSSSESITAIHNNSPTRVYKTHLLVSSKSKHATEHGSFEKIRASLKEAFEQKLRDLGIDPEWQGIPKATFKQKMDIIKHHQKLAAKKAPKYHQIKLKIIDELLAKMSRKGRGAENCCKAVRSSPSHRMITNVKSGATNAFSEQDDLGTTHKKFHSTPETNQPIKNIIEYESPIKPVKPASYNTIEKLVSLSPNETKTFETPQRTRSSLEPIFRRDSINSTKPLYRSLFTNKTVDNGSIENSNVQQKLQTAFASPKHNKSVLKSANGSTSSLTKKKVIFDLENEKDRATSDDEDDDDEGIEKEVLSGSNYNSSSTFGDEMRPSEPEISKSSSNIVLKTTQSDKIAEISKKLEAQLSMARQKPIGSIETIFSSKYIQSKEHHNRNDEEINSSSISSFLASPITSAILNSKKSNNTLPQPAPRNLKDKMSETSRAESISEISDLDSDIDKILKLE